MTEMSLVYVIGKEMGLVEEEMMLVYSHHAKRFSHDIYIEPAESFLDEVESIRRTCGKVLAEFRSGLALGVTRDPF